MAHFEFKEFEFNSRFEKAIKTLNFVFQSSFNEVFIPECEIRSFFIDF